ncbi:hypothetical protein [Neorhodopirellula lusitana]|uniref:hypothetical protein n=1 Tax=Neorhodopirellula lusitana TaxID=445327 RepID=UPI0024B7DF3E|nr:hypothetical protein [Neorhodopirellula lusitana]
MTFIPGISIVDSASTTSVYLLGVRLMTGVPSRTPSGGRQQGYWTVAVAEHDTSTGFIGHAG